MTPENKQRTDIDEIRSLQKQGWTGKIVASLGYMFISAAKFVQQVRDGSVEDHLANDWLGEMVVYAIRAEAYILISR